MIHIETSGKSFDGINIVSQYWTPDERDPKAVVCLVHGLGEHTSRYTHVAEAFVKSGYALFGADMRGHGRSGGKRGHIPSIDAELKDIDTLFKQAATRFPGIPLILYGHSLGGILVLHYALKRNPPVKGVIATSSGLRTALENQPAKIMAARILGSLIPAIQLRSGLDVNALSRDPNVVHAYKNDPLVHDFTTLGFGKIMLGVAKWTLRHAREFQLPLLLIHGKSDAIAFPSGSIEFADSLNGKCVLRLIDGGYHELHNDSCKEEMLNTLIAWMDGLLSNEHSEINSSH